MVRNAATYNRVENKAVSHCIIKKNLTTKYKAFVIIFLVSCLHNKKLMNGLNTIRQPVLHAVFVLLNHWY